MSRKVTQWAPALALVVLCAVTVGCDRKDAITGKPAEKPLPEVYPLEGNAYMNDPVFKQQLDAGRKEMTKALAARTTVAKAMEAAVAKAQAEKRDPLTDPEYLKLKERLEAADKAFSAAQEKQRILAAKRIQQAQVDSKRIADGKAQAKK